jgi:hypothetical protein
VTGSNGGGSRSVSTAGRAVDRIPPQNTTGPTITGSGDTKTCSPGTWTGVPAPTFSYEWLRNDVAILGAQEPTYALTDADEGTTLKCRVTAANGATVTATSAGVAIPIRPRNTVKPTVTGTNARTCDPGTWTGTAPLTYTYVWLLDGAVIAGAADQVYSPKENEAAHALACRVTAENPAGAGIATSDAITLPAIAPRNTARPTLTVDGVLTCEPGTWAGGPPPTFAFQWLRDGGPIAGAASDRYTVVVAT